MPPLVGGIECLSAGLIDGQTREPAAALAERCMRQSGMPVRCAVARHADEAIWRREG